MIRSLFEFNKTDRPWHLPVLAGLCVAIPVFSGYYLNNFQAGKLAAFAGLVVLYMQSNNLAQRIITLMTCCFGILISFAIGLSFSFNIYVSSLVLFVFAFFVNRAIFLLNIDKRPGNFFFILIASMAMCMPFDLENIPRNIGYVGIGTMISFLTGLIYSLFTVKYIPHLFQKYTTVEDGNSNLIDSVIIGFFVGISLLIAKLLALENPYWVPTSCIAVLQGISTKHVFNRTFQRIMGTILGLILTWIIFTIFNPSVFYLCLVIVFLQILVELLIFRNYAISVVFMTALTLLLAEASSALITDINILIKARLIDILLGSSVGAIGGWILYNREVRHFGRKQIRVSKLKLQIK